MKLGQCQRLPLESAEIDRAVGFPVGFDRRNGECRLGASAMFHFYEEHAKGRSKVGSCSPAEAKVQLMAIF